MDEVRHDMCFIHRWWEGVNIQFTFMGGVHDTSIWAECVKWISCRTNIFNQGFWKDNVGHSARIRDNISGCHCQLHGMGNINGVVGGICGGNRWYCGCR